jgi:hypothetical protein
LVDVPRTILDDDDDDDVAGSTKMYELSSLTIDGLRKLCKNIGVVNCGSHNKYNCGKAIATYFR